MSVDPSQLQRRSVALPTQVRTGGSVEAEPRTTVGRSQGYCGKGVGARARCSAAPLPHVRQFATMATCDEPYKLGSLRLGRERYRFACWGNSRGHREPLRLEPKPTRRSKSWPLPESVPGDSSSRYAYASREPKRKETDLGRRNVRPSLPQVAEQARDCHWSSDPQPSVLRPTHEHPPARPLTFPELRRNPLWRWSGRRRPWLDEKGIGPPKIGIVSVRPPPVIGRVIRAIEGSGTAS